MSRQHNHLSFQDLLPTGAPTKYPTCCSVSRNESRPTEEPDARLSEARRMILSFSPRDWRGDTLGETSDRAGSCIQVLDTVRLADIAISARVCLRPSPQPCWPAPPSGRTQLLSPPLWLWVSSPAPHSATARTLAFSARVATGICATGEGLDFLG